MLKANVVLIAILFTLIATLAGCGGNGNSIVAPPAGVPAGGTVVTDNPIETMPFDQVQNLARGTKLKVRLNRVGYEVREYPCTLISAFVETGEHLVQCQMPDNVTVGAGDSGSPVSYQGKIIGALAYGYFGNSKDFLAKSIEDMDEVNGYVATSAVTSRRPIGLAFQTNASQRAIDLMKAMGRGNDQFVITSGVMNTRGGTAEPASAIAGQSVSVDYVRGDLLNGGAVGTLTYQQPNGTWLAFGHPLDFAGPRSIPVSLAWVDAMIDTVLWSFKQAHPTKESFGALAQDRQQGCLIDPSVISATSPIVVRAVVGGREATYRHDLLRDGGSNTEMFFCGLSVVMSLDRALGQIAKLAGTGTVVIKFEGEEPLTFSINTPDQTYGDAPSNASDEVIQAVMGHIHDFRNSPQGFNKGIEYVQLDVEFTNWTPPDNG